MQPTAPDPDALQIVLFGMPDAGKSSLLGALAQAAQTQEHLLNGHLTDRDQSLDELKRTLYEERPRETLHELVPHPVTFEPFTASKHSTPEKLGAVLTDCDGRVANDLLSRRRSLDRDSAEGTLAGAILEADTLVLVVDASAATAQIDADFAEFVRFLHTLEDSRGKRSEVGGLPVFLVLTKCDLLARPGDTAAAWRERIEERKRQVDRRFHEFLEEEASDQPLPFGSIDLHLEATAIKKPALADAPAQPHEPFGIAELFRQLFEEARVHRNRHEHSERRLLYTVGAASAVVLGLVALALTLFANRPQERPSALLNKLEGYRSREPQTPSARLREPLQPKISELTDLKNDPEFAALPDKEKEYLGSRLKELEEYRAYKQKLQQVRVPADATGERELEKIETDLTELSPPGERQAEWGQTEAALLRGQHLDDIKAIRAAVSDLDDWYRRVLRRGEELWSLAEHKPREGGPLPWRDWHGQVQKLLDETESQPHTASEKLPNANRVTYTTVLRYDRIADDRRAWETLKLRLVRLRDLTAALGLAGSVPGKPAVLEIPAPAQFPLTRAAERVQDLDRYYPRHVQEFTLSDLPEAAVGEVRRAARSSYENLRDVRRGVVLQKLRDAATNGQESLEGWRRLRPWLANPEDLQAWRRLANLLLRLQQVDARDPIAALDAFLALDQFPLEIKYVTLELPDDLKLRPVGKLSIQQRSGGENKPGLTYDLYRDGRRDPRRRVTAYSFQPIGATTLVYRPGDSLWADLELKDADNQDWVLTWSSNRSHMYEFERLARLPWLRRKSQATTEGKFAEGITLIVEPEQGLAVVPDLIPVVPAKLDQR